MTVYQPINTSIYVYRWDSSQVLIFFYPQFLQGLSLKTCSVVIYYGNITVDPLHNRIDKIRLFNVAIIWASHFKINVTILYTKYFMYVVCTPHGFIG